MEVDMVTDKELGKVNDMVAEMEVDMVATITKLFKLKLLQSQTFSSQCFSFGTKCPQNPGIARTGLTTTSSWHLANKSA